MTRLPFPVTLARKIYTSMVRIRSFEERICRLYSQQEMRCPVHLSTGQEAIAAGTLIQLRRQDYVVSTHRNHGHLIAKGAALKSMFAEMYGRQTGCSRGKGGSMHMSFPQAGIAGTSAIVAGGLPIAVGLAWGSVLQKNRRISAVFFGDGAVDEGTFYESLNFASLKKLPVVFVCENNFYATNSPQKARQTNPRIHEIARFFRIPGTCIDGNDVVAVYTAAAGAIERCRKGAGPSLIEARTFRWKTHVGVESDLEKGFRRQEEVALWFRRCPVKRFERYLLSRGMVSQQWIDTVRESVDKEISRAVEFARNSPYPRPETESTDV